MKILLVSSLLLILCHSQLLGIDLGTMYTKVATVQPGAGLSFTILQNTKSERKIETAISFHNQHRFYQQEALSKRSKSTKNSFLYTKMFVDMLNSPENFESISKQYFLNHKIEHEADSEIINFIIEEGFKDKIVISIEQVFGMIFKHIRDLAQKLYSKIKIQDCVITIPYTWKLKQRTLIINSLKIAGLNPLHIITQNSAAAVQYGINRQLNATHKVLFYNLGANSLQLSVAQYKKQKNASKKQTIQVFVLGGYGITNVGGLKFDQIISKRLSNIYQTKHKKQLSDKGRVRLLAESKKVKEILSANRQIHVALQELDGVDFHTVLNRQDFESDSRELFSEITNPILPFLKSIDLVPNDIKYVELIGGSSRIPKIQQLISSLFKQSEVGTHINGDQAMAFGSAFVAANSSKKYKVKGLQLYDGFHNFDISLSIKNLDSTIEENDEGYINKNVKVFKKGQRFGLVKDILLKTKENVVVEFSAEYQDGVVEKIKRINILNVTQYKKDYPNENPKLSLSIKTNTINIVDIVEAKLNIVRDQEAAYFEQVKKQSSKTKKEKNKPKEQESSQKEDQEQSKSDGQNDKSEQKEKQKQKQKQKQKIAKEAKDEYQTVRKTRMVSKTHSLKLKLEQKWLSSPFFTESELQAKRSILYKFQKSESEQRKLSQAKNKLESLIYESQQLLQTDWFIEYSVKQQQQKIKEQIATNEQKLYQNLDTSEFNTLYKQFNRLVERIKTRRNQEDERDRVQKTVYQNIEIYKEKYQKFIEENDWLSDNQKSKFDQTLKYVEGELESAYSKLKTLKKTDDPLVLNKQLLKLVDKVKEEYMTLMSIQKPKKATKKDQEKEKEKQAKEQSVKKDENKEEEKPEEKKEKKQKSKGKKKPKKDDYMDQL